MAAWASWHCNSGRFYLVKNKNGTFAKTFLMVTIGIVGGTGYTAGELLRILINHPQVQIMFVQSASQAGKQVCSVHSDLAGDTELVFSDKITDTDVLFLCLGHGVSVDFLSKNNISPQTRIIDLGSDFRINGCYCMRNFVYGLPEINKNKIRLAQNIANPGCFATAMQLALLPLSAHKMLCGEIHINAITGSSGAGRALSETSHFSYRTGNISVYKPFTHQHLAEVQQTLLACNENNNFELCFIPVRGNFVRGIFASIYLGTSLSQGELIELYSKFYEHQPFVHIATHDISLKDVVNTNKCLLRVQKIGQRAFITAAIDNLLKGASGQAVQNMNLMVGLPESMGLNLKPLGL
jgi:N-acetyl-gamma-glutamyl-phosphate reductase